MQNITSSQASPEVTINENFALLSWAACYGQNVATTTGLVWGYFGGMWGGQIITPSTLTLAASATNYLVVHRVSGVLSTATSTTNWDNRATYARVYSVQTGASAISFIYDHRGGPAGVHGQA